MNVLIVYCIKTMGETCGRKLKELMRGNTILLHHYDMHDTDELSIQKIVTIIDKREINVLVLDRSLSKAEENDEDDFVYLSTKESDRALKKKAEQILLGDTGLLKRSSEGQCKLISIIIHTYDKGNNKIDAELIDIETKLDSALRHYGLRGIQIHLFETSTIFNKPTDTDIYPDNFYLNATARHRLNYSIKGKRNIGTKTAYAEYGKLIASVTNSIVDTKDKGIYSFNYKGNKDFDRYLRAVSGMQLKGIEEKLEYYSDNGNELKNVKVGKKFEPIELLPGTVSALFSFEGEEKYYIDIPYKEYYEELNKSIKDHHKLLFRDNAGKYISKQYVYYSYNYKNGEFELYDMQLSEGLSNRSEYPVKDVAKSWLPFLHCGLFHFSDSVVWENSPIRDVIDYSGNRINMFFLIDTITVEDFKGHINFTFYNEDIKNGTTVKPLTKEEIEEHASRIASTLSPILKAKATDAIIPELSLLVEKQALHAAISQVMARNTSHNIGAHVMNKLIGDLSKLVIRDFNKYRSSIDISNDKTDNEVLLDQISIFNNYVKCRMDYLADISFTTPLMQTNKYAYGELYKELDRVRLLLEHISGLDEFQYKIEFKRNGVPLDETNDLLVAIPNDILGTQAFCNILENTIRNTAKHSDKSKLGEDDDVVFTVDFIDDINKARLAKADNKIEIENILNEFIAVEIYDNIPVDGKGEDLTDEEKDEFIRSRTEVINAFPSKIDRLVFDQNKRLNEDILHEGKLRSYALGLVEMDASATYLRKQEVSFINHNSYNIHYNDSWSRDTELNEGDSCLRGTNCRHFLKAFKKAANEKSYLGYRFFLLRPAVALVVTDLCKEDTEKKDELKKHGVWVIRKDEFLDKKKVYNHEFVIVDKMTELPKEDLDKRKTALPIRIIEEEHETLETLFNKTDNLLEEWEQHCWEKWEEKAYGKIDISIGRCRDPRSTDFQVVFLDHLYSPGSIPEESWSKNVTVDHLEALSSLAQSKMPDFYKITQTQCRAEKTSDRKFKCYVENLDSNDLVKRKIKEAVLNKVIVIDERIQEAAEKGEFMKIPYKNQYEKMNVVIPDRSINLSANSYTPELIGDIKQYITGEIAGMGPTDFILIHYSILERMFAKEKINEALKTLLQESKVNVVITSGRGTPNGLPGEVRFVNLSSVIAAFVDVKSKYAINYLLNSSRKSGKI